MNGRRGAFALRAGDPAAPLRARAETGVQRTETGVHRGSSVSPEMLAVQTFAGAKRESFQLAVRLRVRLHRRVLDREIAAGAAVDSDPARALRALQLTGARERQRVAGCLANILEAAEERHADPGSPVRLNHADVLAARHKIVAVIEVLRSDQVVAARGAALAGLLIVERRSPMLCERSGRTVQQAVSEALVAL